MHTTIQLTLLRKAEATYLRDLPLLLKVDARRWVVYHGDRRLGIVETKPAAYRLCDQMNFSPDDCLVEFIAEPQADVLMGPGQMSSPLDPTTV